MLLPDNEVTLIVAPVPFLSDIEDVVIPNTSPTTYPEPPVLLVTFATIIPPEAFVSIVAVKPLPLPMILYKGTFE